MHKVSQDTNRTVKEPENWGNHNLLARILGYNRNKSSILLRETSQSTRHRDSESAVTKIN